jgi:MerR family transcriptional regulator, copper efflux regulator
LDLSTHSGHKLRVGDLARMTGKTVRAIHLYEELGLLKPVSRSSGGFRLYEDAAIERVRWIDLLHGLGFSLNEMRELSQAWWGAGLGPEAMERLRALFHRKLDDTRAAVERHQQLARELEQGLAWLQACRACTTPASTVEACVGCRQDHGMTHEPALVAGLTSAPALDALRHARGFVKLEDILESRDSGER